MLGEPFRHYILEERCGLAVRINLYRLARWYLHQLIRQLRARRWFTFLLLLIRMPPTLLRAGVFIPFFIKFHIQMGAFLG